MLELVLNKINSYAKHEMSTKSVVSNEFQLPENHLRDVDQRFERISVNHANRLNFCQNIGATI